MSDSLVASTRAMASVPPPGGKGTMRRTKRFGKLCAAARPITAGASTIATDRVRSCRRPIIAAPLVDPDSGILDDRSPLGDLDLEQRAKLLGRRPDLDVADRLELLLDRRVGERGDGARLDLLDDVGRGLG